jgi:hypothetical protein
MYLENCISWNDQSQKYLRLSSLTSRENLSVCSLLSAETEIGRDLSGRKRKKAKSKTSEGMAESHPLLSRGTAERRAIEGRLPTKQYPRPEGPRNAIRGAWSFKQLQETG